VDQDIRMPEDQTVVGKEEHTHPGDLHSHDHYHVSHHHTGGLLGEFTHRAHYHQHEHSHAPLVHAHEKYDEDQERADHNGTAHVHDHEDPMGVGL
jgi:hypothetical protein